MRLTWLGHSSVLLRQGRVSVIADPVLRPRTGALRRVAPLPPQALGLLASRADGDAAVDAVLISHLHHDHCDLPTLRRLRARRVIVPPGAGAFLTRRGIAGVVELAAGQRLALTGGVSVTAVPAEHVGRREPWGPTALSVGHLVESAGCTVWLAGDTGLFEAMRGLPGLGVRGRVDLAAVPVWGWGPNLGPGHLDPQQAARAVRRVGARLAVPVHWGTLHPAGLRRAMLHQLLTPGPRFADALAGAAGAAEPALLAPGQEVDAVTGRSSTSRPATDPGRPG